MTAEDPVKTVCIIDFETASMDPASACSVGWSLIHNQDGQWESRGIGYERLIRPPRNVQLNTQYHGIAEQETSHLPGFRSVWEEEVAPMLLKEKVDRLASHNAKFDAAVLWCSLLGDKTEKPMMPLYAARRLMRDHRDEEMLIGCTLQAAYKLLPDRLRGTYKLGALAKDFKITLVNAHRASEDAAATAQVAAELLNRSDNNFDDLMRSASGLFRFGWLGPQPVGYEDKRTGWQDILWGVNKAGRISFHELQRQRGNIPQPQLSQAA